MINRLLVLLFVVMSFTGCKTAQTSTGSSPTTVSTTNENSSVPLEKKFMNTTIEPKKEHPHIKLKSNN